MDYPLVTVICLCYNHRFFLEEAVESVLAQTYPSIQIILIDDASTDDSVLEIEKIIVRHPVIEFVSLKQNLGNCKAFNRALAKARGEYIIDFSTDDVMMPDRIRQQVDFFLTLDKDYGIVFTDAVYIDKGGGFLYNHVENLRLKKLLSTIPQGDIYVDVISTYFISSPTMMIRKEVLDSMHGYDEALAYEDFDLWVRSSRNYKYAFLNEKLTKVRRSKDSMSSGWYRQGDAQLYSTFLVCKKIQQLNRTPEEKQSLLKRVRYELRQSVFSENNREAKLFYELLKELGGVRLEDEIFYRMEKLKLPLSGFRRLYHKVVFGR